MPDMQICTAKPHSLLDTIVGKLNSLSVVETHIFALRLTLPLYMHILPGPVRPLFSSIGYFTSYGLFVEKVLFVTFVGKAHKKLDQVHDWPPRERVLVATALVPEVWVSLVVEHLVRCQVHTRVQDL